MDTSRTDSIKEMTESKSRISQTIVFALTYLSYASLHACRTTWAYTKSSIEKDFGFGDHFLGIIDMTFLLAYASGLYLGGMFMHKLNLKTYIICGMIGSAVAFGGLGLVGSSHHESRLSLWLSMLVFGLCQSTVTLYNIIDLTVTWFIGWTWKHSDSGEMVSWSQCYHGKMFIQYLQVTIKELMDIHA